MLYCGEKLPYPTSIPAAAKLLDEVKPGWANEIDMGRLDINDFNRCILGQLFSTPTHNGYEAALFDLFGAGPHSLTSLTDEVFGWRASIDKWKTEICARK